MKIVIKYTKEEVQYLKEQLKHRGIAWSKEVKEEMLKVAWGETLCARDVANLVTVFMDYRESVAELKKNITWRVK